MSTVHVRILRALRSPDGHAMIVDAQLPDGSFITNAIVEGAGSREDLALRLAAFKGDRIVPGFTGLVELDERTWQAAVEAAEAATTLSAPATAEAPVAVDAASDASADEESAKSAKSAKK